MGTGPQSVTGALTWNYNGTLQKLVLTDQINAANTQTCKYGDPGASVAGYDDLGRLVKADCSSAWSQTFGPYDAFGNITKTGTAQFLPTYTGASGTSTSPTNQYYQLTGGPAGSTNYYDTNGNLKNDLTHTYTWDADGNMLSVDGSTVTMIYDALDRMIEQTRGSNHTEIVYGPYGMKLALMNGQTLVNAFVKLPGGARAVYNSSGLAFYRHADYLGSSRLATTPSRTKYYDVAYAPYGEDYNASGTTPDLSFTDQNQDTEGGGWSTNLFDFMFREYRTGHGRWASPDPAGLYAVDPSNPQSWNRYAYVANNPLSFVDPLGLILRSIVCPAGTQNVDGTCVRCPNTLGGIQINGEWVCGFTGPSNLIPVPPSCASSGQCGSGQGGGSNANQPNQPQQPKPKPKPQDPPKPKPICGAINRAGNITAGVGGVSFLIGTGLELTGVGVPVGLGLQFGGGVAMGVGAVEVGVGEVCNWLTGG